MAQIDRYTPTYGRYVDALNTVKAHDPAAADDAEKALERWPERIDIITDVLEDGIVHHCWDD